MIKYKHIQTAHEIRMWILMLAAGGVAVEKILEANPYLKHRMQTKLDKLKSKFTKEEQATETEEKIIKVVIVREGES